MSRAPVIIDAGTGGTAVGTKRATVHVSQQDLEGSATGRRAVAATAIDAAQSKPSTVRPTAFMQLHP